MCYIHFWHKCYWNRQQQRPLCQENDEQSSLYETHCCCVCLSFALKYILLSKRFEFSYTNQTHTQTSVIGVDGAVCVCVCVIFFIHSFFYSIYMTVLVRLFRSFAQRSFNVCIYVSSFSLYTFDKDVRFHANVSVGRRCHWESLVSYHETLFFAFKNHENTDTISFLFALSLFNSCFVMVMISFWLWPVSQYEQWTLRYTNMQFYTFTY